MRAPPPHLTLQIRLWAHEVLRVFYDRLVDDKDREWLIKFLKETTRKNFSTDLDGVVAHLLEDGQKEAGPQEFRKLIFGDWGNPADAERVYKELTDAKAMVKVCEGFLDDYNAMSKKPMNLVLFMFAIEHVARVCRVLRQPGGHALLVGVGGSGRQSATRLAAFIADYKVFEIEISKSYGKAEWREDLKKMLKTAGGEGKPSVFLFCDTQIKQEAFVEDINNLLNTGEVPNLFASDEKQLLCEAVRNAAKDAGRDVDAQSALYAFFIDRCKQMLHICLCFSPIGDAFRNRLRQFPSLVNCCTIDWFTEWPKDALVSVAQRFLSDVEMPDKVRDSCVMMCQQVHDSGRDMSRDFLARLRRHNYVTPTSYLELITTYKTLLARKRSELLTVKGRYEVGLEKLANAAAQVAEMSKELEALQPVLIVSKKETEELSAQVEKKVPEVEAAKAVAAADEAEANKKATEVKKIKDECEADLAEAIPILNDAIKALDTVKKADIDLVKSMKNPPSGVKLAMHAVCVMLDIKPEKKNDPDNPGKKIIDFWGPSVKLLSEGKLLDTLKAYDKDNIDPKIMAIIRAEFVTNEEFKPDVRVPPPPPHWPSASNRHRLLRKGCASGRWP